MQPGAKWRAALRTRSRTRSRRYNFRPNASRASWTGAWKRPMPNFSRAPRIVNQVAAMKSMVDAFAGYARMPRAKLEALDLNTLVRDVLTLYDAKTLGLVLSLDADLPRIVGDATLLRQVIHNLLQNAQDALAGHAAPCV